MSWRERVSGFLKRGKPGVESPQVEVVPYDPFVTVKNASERTGDLLRGGATPQQIFDDALCLALEGNIERIDDIDNTTRGGVTITELPKRTS